MKRKTIFSTALMMLVCVSTPSHAQVYHYVDKNGKKVFVDRKSQIPDEYRDQLEVREQSTRRSRAVTGPAVAADDSLATHKAKLESFMESLEMPVTIRGNSVIVPVNVLYGNARFNLGLVLDTGASKTVVHADKLSHVNVFTTPSGNARIADGAVIETRNLMFDEVKIGPYTSRSVSVSVIDHKAQVGYDGLLGMDFLRSAKYDIDFDRELIVWQRDDYRKAQEQLAEVERRMAEEKEAAAQSADSAQPEASQ